MVGAEECKVLGTSSSRQRDSSNLKKALQTRVSGAHLEKQKYFRVGRGQGHKMVKDLRDGVEC